jgi:saccharopine dehydrogenase (NAD+, L-lysine-forming)
MPVCIGIRHEDKSIWERRVPVIPEHVKELIEDGVKVFVEPSATRIFKEDEFKNAGATIQKDLSNCPVVFGVKEIPASFFQENSTYIFFSHVIKGQSYNMPMLKRMMELKCQLIDYERIIDDKGMRLIFFGWHAGVSGMVESIAALGQRLKNLGIDNPFTAQKQPLNYDSIEEIKGVLAGIGQQIKTNGLPKEILPLTVGFAGYGNVSRGAQEMLDILPTREVSPAELKNITAGTEGAANTIFKVVFKEQDMVHPKAPADSFVLQDYYDHPEKYEGNFEDYLPHLSVLVNCIYWDERYPRLVTKNYLKQNWQGSRLQVIGDISCDINGSIEATEKAPEPGNPVYVYDPFNGTITDGVDGNGPVIMAVDILPSEIPRDASNYFSNVLKGYIPDIAKADYGVAFEDLALPDEIKRAVILHRGQLTPDYEYISKFL